MWLQLENLICDAAPRGLGALLGFLLAGALCCGDPVDPSTAEVRSAKPADHRRPNVILIVVDTLRKDHLGVYGYERDTSPHIDRLAQDSLRYDLAISQAPWTTPSIGSLLTSLYPTSLGIRGRRSALSREHVLLPEVLEANGYRTGAVISHHFCSAEWNFDQGFEEFDQSNIKGHQAVTSEGVSDRAIEFVKRNREQPFFLWVHYFDPHENYVEHPQFPFAADSKYRGPISSRISFPKLRKLKESMNSADLAELLRIYDSEIAYTDRQIGRLLQRLRVLGLYEDSIIVLTADHGEEFLDHGEFGHAKTLYQELVNVPLLIKIPEVSPGVVTHAVGLIDIYPTLLDALKLEPESELAGRSLLSERVSSAEAARPVFSETSREGGLRSVVVDGYQLVIKGRGDKMEFYDLARDPQQLRDLAEIEVERASELAALLEKWRSQVESDAEVAPELELSTEQLQELEALGYRE